MDINQLSSQIIGAAIEVHKTQKIKTLCVLGLPRHSRPAAGWQATAGVFAVNN